MPERRVIEAIPVEVRRSKRRRTRIGLAFDPGGYVIMEAPLDASEAEIHSVIREHRRWLRHRLDKAAEGHALSSNLRYASGELVHYLGDPYELHVQYGGTRNGVRLCQRLAACAVRGQIHITSTGCAGAAESSDERVRGLLNDWYRSRASDYLYRQLERWRVELPWMGGPMPSWRHRFMRSQWGSCSRSGRISLNTHLVKTPPRLMEYVVLHELCHLRHHDHSHRFYALMERHMPDWRVRRGELDRYLPVLLQE